MTVATPLFQQRPLTFRGVIRRAAGLPRNRNPAGRVEPVKRRGGTGERGEKEQIERVINPTVRGRFAAGAVQRAVLLEHGDDPGIGPGQLMVRVFVPAPDEPTEYERALAEWQEANQAGMDQLRRELLLRLPG